MSPRDELIEKMWEALWAGDEFKSITRKDLRAALDAARALGWELVPAIPTEKMMRAAIRVVQDDDESRLGYWSAAWKAMLAASQHDTEGQ